MHSPFRALCLIALACALFLAPAWPAARAQSATPQAAASAMLVPQAVQFPCLIPPRPVLDLPLGGHSVAANGVVPPAQSAEQQPDAASAVMTTTMTGEQLQSLPTSGRRWQQLFLDMPAAAPSSAGAQLALRGAGDDPPDTTIDGSSTRLAFGSGITSASVLPAQDPAAQETGEGKTGFSGGRGVAIAMAAIREVHVVAGNVESEGSHAAGGRAGVETESGGNQLHGQGFSPIARTPGVRGIPLRSGLRTPVRLPRLISPPSRLRRPITRPPGDWARAAASAATRCSGSPRSTATGATIQASPLPRNRWARINMGTALGSSARPACPRPSY